MQAKLNTYTSLRSTTDKNSQIILSQKSKGYPGIQGNVYFNSFKFLAIRTPILITAR